MYQLHVPLSDREYQHFIKQVKASGLSRSAFIRSLIMGEEVKPMPTAEYAGFLRELSAIGNNINDGIVILRYRLSLLSEQDNFVRFWLHRFHKLDIRQQIHRKIFIDTFTHSMYLYDYKIIIIFSTRKTQEPPHLRRYKRFGFGLCRCTK